MCVSRSTVTTGMDRRWRKRISRLLAMVPALTRLATTATFRSRRLTLATRSRSAMKREAA